MTRLQSPSCVLLCDPYTVSMLCPFGRRVKIHKTTPVVGSVKWTHRYWRWLMTDTEDQMKTPLEISHIHILHPDGALKNAVRTKINHYRRLYTDCPDSIVFIPLTVNTSGPLYHDFMRLIFLYAHWEVSDLVRQLPGTIWSVSISSIWMVISP